jgi:hypothetical protein
MIIMEAMGRLVWQDDILVVSRTLAGRVEPAPREARDPLLRKDAQNLGRGEGEDRVTRAGKAFA